MSLFFLTPPNFRDASTFAYMIWLWPAITPVKKLARPKNTTFSETSGSQLSHGPILEKFSHQKISRRRVFSKKRRFLQFFVSAPKKFQMAANRTILMLEGLPMAHKCGSENQKVVRNTCNCSSYAAPRLLSMGITMGKFLKMGFWSFHELGAC